LDLNFLIILKPYADEDLTKVIEKAPAQLKPENA